MNNYVPKELTGSLFKNDKGGNESRPDYRGDVCIGGDVYKVAGWIKEGSKGKYMSLSFQPKDEQQQVSTPAPRAKAAPAPAFDDSDVPFITCAFGNELMTSKEKKLKSYDY